MSRPRNLANPVFVALLPALWAFSAGLSGCVPDRPYVWIEDLPITPDAGETIEPRDTLLVSVRNQPTLSGDFVVGDHGEYLQPTLGSIEVAGLTTKALEATLKSMLNGIVVNPDVAVSITKIATVRVNVVGEVKTPGSYELTRGRGVLPALAAAGWMTEFADRSRVFVIRAEGTNVQRIRFRARELTAAEPHAVGFRLKDGDVVVVE